MSDLKVGGTAVATEWADGLTQAFGQSRANRIARNAVTSSDVHKAARNPVTMRAYHDTFGVSLKTAKTVTNQRQSGRCWMFATLNVLRSKVMKRLDVDDFEFSQAFGMFYDKLEKANSFLNYVVDTAHLPWDDRTVTSLLEVAGSEADGGEWAWASNLIDKWGAVPKEVMPETACTKNSAQMDNVLGRMLRRDAVVLRRLICEGEGADAVEAARESMLADVHRVLCSCLGEPPATFDLEVEVGKDADVDASVLFAVEGAETDANKPRRLLRDRAITPRDFVERYVGFDGDDYVELVSVPASDLAYGHVYGIRMVDTVAGGRVMKFLNVAPEVIEDAATATLKAGVPCYMACDVMQQFGRHLEDFPGVLACDTMDRESLFGVDLSMTRTEMLDAHETRFTHAMTFQGVELGADGRPAAWRVENSWGKESCKDGYLVVSADWWRLYGGDVAVERRFVPDELLKLWDEAPVEQTEPWGSLFCALNIGKKA